MLMSTVSGKLAQWHEGNACMPSYLVWGPGAEKLLDAQNDIVPAGLGQWHCLDPALQASPRFKLLASISKAGRKALGL